jgi:phytoene dehydrogenase-like protein
MAQPPSDKSLMSILSAANKSEPTAAELDAAAELEYTRGAKAIELYQKVDRLQEEKAAEKPIDEEEYNRLVQVLPAELRDLSLAKDPKLLETILKSVKDRQVDRTRDIEKLRAGKAKMELILAILLQGYDPDAIRTHLQAAEGVSDAVRISEMERQIKAQAEQLKAQAEQLKALQDQVNALQDQVNAMQDQISGAGAQVQQHE